MPIYGICTAFLAREAAFFYRLLGKVGKSGKRDLRQVLGQTPATPRGGVTPP